MSDNQEKIVINVCNRFDEEIKRTNTSISSVADICVVSTKTVTRWRKETPIPSDKLELLLPTDIDIVYVVSGNRSNIAVNEKRESYRNHDDYASIPHYNVQVAAGHGALNHIEEQLKPLAFRRDWLVSRHLNANSLVVVDVSGDSMEPYLKDNDLVLVDTSQTEIASGKTYVFRMKDELYVKNLQRLPNDIIQVASFNSGFPPYQVDLNNGGIEINMIGRVVASMHEW